jgi:cytoskeleton protein RodZ
LSEPPAPSAGGSAAPRVSAVRRPPTCPLHRRDSRSAVFEIGPTLREARVRRKLTLQQVEEDTKIRIKYIQAMENEEFDIMPGSTYVKGFLRSYAFYLGLDPDLIIDEYRSRYAPRAPRELSANASALKRPPRSRRRSGLAFIAVVAVLILALIYVLGLRGGGGGSDQPSVNPSVLHSTTPSPTLSPTSHASASPSVTAGARTTVELSSAGDPCYVEVHRATATGPLIYQGLISAANGKDFTTRTALYIKVGGNPANLVVVVDGREVSTSGDKSGAVYRVSNGKLQKL